MGIVYQQTDLAGSFGIVLPADAPAIGLQSFNRSISSSGTPGSAEVNVEIAANSTQTVIAFESPAGEPNVLNWTAGAWTVELNVTSPKNKTVWKQLHICRINSAGVIQETLVRAMGANVNIDSGGIVSHTLTTTSATTALATDRIYVVLVLQNKHSSFSRVIGITPSVTITSPLATGTTTLTPTPVVATVTVPIVTINTPLILTPSAVVAGVVVPAVVVARPITLKPTPVGVTVAVPTPIVGETGITLLPTPVVATAAVPTPTVLGVAGVLRVWDGSNWVTIGGTGSQLEMEAIQGDVLDNAIIRADGTAGTEVQGSKVLLDNDGNIDGVRVSTHDHQGGSSGEKLDASALDSGILDDNRFGGKLLSIATVPTVFPNNKYITATDPTVNDDSSGDWDRGSTWIHTSDHHLWEALAVGVGAAVWKELTGIGDVAIQTIAAGVITLVDDHNYQFVRVRNEAAAATDDLNTITAVPRGRHIIVQADQAAQTVVLKDGVDNLELNGDMVLDHIYKAIILVSLNGVRWIEVARNERKTSGDFSGPASSTDDAIVRFNGTGGKTGQNCGITIGDDDLLTSPKITVLGDGSKKTLNIVGKFTVSSNTHRIETRSGASTDDLVGILGGVLEQRINIRPFDTNHTVVVKDQGTLHLAGDFSMDSDKDNMDLLCISAGATWVEISRSNNRA